LRSRVRPRERELPPEPEPPPPAYYGTPGWVWPVGMFVLVCILCAVLFCVFLLLRHSSGGSSEASAIRTEFEKVKLGMTPDQVTKILGKPTDDGDPAMSNITGDRVMTWTDKKTYTLVVTFRGGAVVAKHWDETGTRR